MAEKYTWVGIPANATSLEECTIFFKKPDLNGLQTFVEGLIQPMPKVWNVKGIREVFVNEEGVWKGFTPNIILNSMIGEKKMHIMSPYGVLNMRVFGERMTVIKQGYKGHMMGARGNRYQVVGPAVAQIKLSTLNSVIADLPNFDVNAISMDGPQFAIFSLK